MRTLKFLLIIGIVSFGLYSFDQILQEEWKIPDKYIKMKNPTYVDKDNLEMGKALFLKHCKSCHGKNGKGDGEKSYEFNYNIINFTTKEFKEQLDGVKFYKSYNGLHEKPNFKKKISDETHMWFILNYMNTLVEEL
ncbi:c-type cytochrome [Lutibacter sp.]|uniref:c-type cytochrome n=1 Tax=Lutibacter sp. TaxID=1925666 RepID=UPI00273267DF|nr:c-type cytochrome [Lutibacter sp.]MDP3313745.1 c-type cytochrome [Lutibacter sp.]